MNCGIVNKSLILSIEYVSLDKIALTANDFARIGHSPVRMADLISVANRQYIKTIIMEAETAKATFDQSKSKGGKKFKNEITFSMLPPAEDSTDEFNQIHVLEQDDFCFIITYFGGAKSFVYTPENCMSFTYSLKDGMYENNIVVENLGGIQPLVE